MNQKVRVRFAPSPTGPLHIGGVRTALFNYLFAKKNSGDFILRIEDTDQNRYVAGAEDYIINALQWCGINPDEGPNINGKFGPYRQSERKALYKKYANELLQSGSAYIAFDTTEELDTHRKEHERKGKTFIYNWHNRLKLNNSLSLSAETVAQKIASNEPYVIRFKIPENEKLILNDIVRGAIQIDTSILDDKILFKSDGMPTYHLANIVDDHLMEISHVIRGEEWLPSLALHVLLYNAFGWRPPKFAHLPLILKPTGKGKLSKRDGDKFGFPVFPLNWKNQGHPDFAPGYKDEGYFPDALVNFLAFLGWNPGTEQELFSLEELVSVFDITKVHKSGARFDPDKIKWYNQQYFQNKNIKELVTLFRKTLRTKLDTPLPDDFILEKIILLLKERATFIADLWDTGYFLFKTPEDYDPKSKKRAWKGESPEIMEKLRIELDSISNFTNPFLQDHIKEWIHKNNLNPGKVMMPLRLSLVGSLQGPDVFEIMEIIGKEESIDRINKAIQLL